MKTSARVLVLGMTILLVAAWTVPVCCLSMNAAPTQPPSNQAAPMAMPGHHHHQQPTGDSQPSSKRLGASEACTQNCDAASTVGAMLLPARPHLDGFTHTSISVAAPLSTSPVQARWCDTGSSRPFGRPLALSDRALPLRI